MATSVSVVLNVVNDADAAEGLAILANGTPNGAPNGTPSGDDVLRASYLHRFQGVGQSANEMMFRSDYVHHIQNTLRQCTPEYLRSPEFANEFESIITWFQQRIQDFRRFDKAQKAQNLYVRDLIVFKAHHCVLGLLKANPDYEPPAAVYNYITSYIRDHDFDIRSVQMFRDEPLIELYERIMKISGLSVETIQSECLRLSLTAYELLLYYETKLQTARLMFRMKIYRYRDIDELPEAMAERAKIRHFHTQILFQFITNFNYTQLQSSHVRQVLDSYIKECWRILDNQEVIYYSNVVV